MLTAIDHLVVVVPDLEAGIRSYRDLGFAVVPGGRHTIGTHNALIAFADGAYLELIAFYEPSPAHRWWAPLQAGGGLVDFCLATDDLAGDSEAFRRAGVDLEGPLPRTRLRPDGYEVRWVLAIPRGHHRGVAPFLIEDETPRAERVPRETAHPNGVTGIGAVTVAVTDLTGPRAWYAPASVTPGEPIGREDLDAHGVRFAIGPHHVELLAPGGRDSPLVEPLRSRGPGTWAASLTVAVGVRDRPSGPLDPARTGGARLVLTRR